MQANAIFQNTGTARLFGLTALIAAAALGGCSSSEKPTSAVAPEVVDQSAGPVALSPRKSSPQTIAMAVNQDELTKAVERLRITKKKGESPFEQAGADL